MAPTIPRYYIYIINNKFNVKINKIMSIIKSFFNYIYKNWF